MRLLVASDLHGSPEAAAFLRRRCEELLPDMLVLLGDYLYHGPRNPLPSSYGPPSVVSVFADFDTPIVAVRGNCDAYSRSDAEENLLFNADGVRIFMTHGHRYNVKLGYESLANAAHFSGAQLALFGHTHRPLLEEDSGVWYMNPGAARSGRYGVIEITDGTFTCELKELPE